MLQVVNEVFAGATPSFSFLGEVAEGRNRSRFYAFVSRLVFKQGNCEDFAVLV